MDGIASCGAGVEGSAMFDVIPAEFHPAQHICPQLILDRERDFLGFVWIKAGGGIENAVTVIHIFSPRIEAQLVGGLNRGVDTKNPGVVVGRIADTVVVIDHIIKREARLERSYWRRERGTRIQAGSAAVYQVAGPGAGSMNNCGIKGSAFQRAETVRRCERDSTRIGLPRLDAHASIDAVPGISNGRLQSEDVSRLICGQNTCEGRRLNAVAVGTGVVWVQRIAVGFIAQNRIEHADFPINAIAHGSAQGYISLADGIATVRIILRSKLKFNMVAGSQIGRA